ncbi:MAG: helix-turn-helix transcriptional regulator [Terriglobales bacterium]
MQRLLLEGWVTAQWKQSETKRRARFYSLTPAGRKQLGLEISSFEKMVVAIRGVLQQC